MGIDPNHFGPYFWATIHFICLGAAKGLTEEQRNGMIQFFNSIPYVIPCASCGEHLKENMARLMPIELAVQSHESLFNWSVDLHNIVNEKLGKPKVSHENAYTFWKNAPYINDTLYSKNEGTGTGTMATKTEKGNSHKESNKNNHSEPMYTILILIIGILIGTIIYAAITRKF